MSFYDKEYVDNYYAKHEFPKIHDDIYSLHEKIKCNNILDLGCCTGLLACRLSEKYGNVVGVEPNLNYLNNAIVNDKITYYNLEINHNTLPQFEQILQKHKIDTIYARRVFPEITDTGGTSLVREVGNVLYKNGVENIVMEGRIERKNSQNKLSNLNKEVEALSDNYKPVHKYKRCAVLQRK